MAAAQAPPGCPPPRTPRPSDDNRARSRTRRSAGRARRGHSRTRRCRGRGSRRRRYPARPRDPGRAGASSPGPAGRPRRRRRPSRCGPARRRPARSRRAGPPRRRARPHPPGLDSSRRSCPSVAPAAQDRTPDDLLVSAARDRRQISILVPHSRQSRGRIPARRPLPGLLPAAGTGLASTAPAGWSAGRGDRSRGTRASSPERLRVDNGSSSMAFISASRVRRCSSSSPMSSRASRPLAISAARAKISSSVIGSTGRSRQPSGRAKRSGVRRPWSGPPESCGDRPSERRSRAKRARFRGFHDTRTSAAGRTRNSGNQ